MTAARPKLDIDTTRDRLMALGCMHAAEQLDQMLTEAVRQEVPAHNFLDRLLQAELSGREGRRVKTSLKLSNYRLGGHWRTSTLPFSRRSSVPASTRWPPVPGCATAKPCWFRGRRGSAKRICWWDLGSARSNRASRCSIFASTN